MWERNLPHTSKSVKDIYHTFFEKRKMILHIEFGKIMQELLENLNDNSLEYCYYFRCGRFEVPPLVPLFQ